MPHEVGRQRDADTWKYQQVVGDGRRVELASFATSRGRTDAAARTRARGEVGEVVQQVMRALARPPAIATGIASRADQRRSGPGPRITAARMSARSRPRPELVAAGPDRRQLPRHPSAVAASSAGTDQWSTPGVNAMPPPRPPGERSLETRAGARARRCSAEFQFHGCAAPLSGRRSPSFSVAHKAAADAERLWPDERSWRSVSSLRKSRTIVCGDQKE